MIFLSFVSSQQQQQQLDSQSPKYSSLEVILLCKSAPQMRNFAQKGGQTA